MGLEWAPHPGSISCRLCSIVPLQTCCDHGVLEVLFALSLGLPTVLDSPRCIPSTVFYGCASHRRCQTSCSNVRSILPHGDHICALCISVSGYIREPWVCGGGRLT